MRLVQAFGLERVQEPRVLAGQFDAGGAAESPGGERFMQLGVADA